MNGKAREVIEQYDHKNLSNVLLDVGNNGDKCEYHSNNDVFLFTISFERFEDLPRIVKSF